MNDISNKLAQCIEILKGQKSVGVSIDSHLEGIVELLELLLKLAALKKAPTGFDQGGGPLALQ